MKAFLSGFLFIVAFALASEAFAGYPALPAGGVVFWSKSGQTQYYSHQGYKDPTTGLIEQAQPYLASCQNSNPDKTCQIQSFADEPQQGAAYNWGPGMSGYTMWVTGYVRVVALPAQASCGIDNISGAPYSGATGSPGIYDVGGCAYSCATDYSRFDGQTSWADAQRCNGLGAPYTSSEPSDYPDEPSQCAVRSGNDCLDMPQGGCPSGSTYGQVNGTNVCVGSGGDTAPLDEGTKGPDGGGGSTPDSGSGDGGSGGDGGDGSTGGDGGDGGSCVPSETNDCSGPGSGGGGGGTGQGEEGEGVPANFTGHAESASWWESQYPDGAQGIATKFSDDVGNGPFMSMLDPLKSLPTSGAEPSWSFNVNLGALGNYGAVNLTLPSGVWAFIRFCILFTATMTCRKLIFGG